MTEAILWYLVFVFSTTVHEAAHAWAALKGGDRTAYLGGQVSLDPRPHIQREPIGMIIFPIIALMLIGWPFGYASAPYDPDWEWKYPKKAGWMAAAGPLSNLCIAIVVGIIMIIGLNTGHFAMTSSPKGLEHIMISEGPNVMQNACMLLSMLFSLNIILFSFNLLPLPPLDGATMLSLILQPAQFRKFMGVIRTPMFGIFGLLIAWNIFPVIFYPIFNIALNIIDACH